jgi:hypothetical protein
MALEAEDTSGFAYLECLLRNFKKKKRNQYQHNHRL